MTTTLNGPGGMYRLEPYVTFEKGIPLPDCMYKMASYHTNITSSAGSQSGHPQQQGRHGAGDATSSELQALERRQEDILNRLHELQDEIKELKKSSHIASVKTAESRDMGGVIQDLVISVDPDSPPLWLLVLKDQLSEQYRVMTSCYVHSSVQRVPDNIKQLFGSNGICYERGNHQLAITVIWKKMSHGPRLMLSPAQQTAIEGESNIARYLARLLSPAYDSTDAKTATLVDQWVDTAQMFSLSTVGKDVLGMLLKSVNGQLAKQEWLAGSGPSLADIMMWSAMTRYKATTRGIKKWLDKCNKHPVFQSAVHFIGRSA